jgi:hypothetical protein
MRSETLNNTAFPDHVPALLHKLATEYRESQAELQDAWQDPQAGRVWGELAKILERAADQAHAAVAKHF